METAQARFVQGNSASPYRRLTLANLMALYRYLLLRARYSNLRCDGLFFFGSGSELRIEPEADVRFGRSVQFMRGCTAHFKGKVTLGTEVFFNRDSNIIVLESLTVGEYSIFGERVSIHDENHNMHGTGPISARGFTTKPIVIGSNVWVGANVTILQGVTIGDNAVIGAHAVVTHDVPAGMLAVGVPARVVRNIESQDTEK